MAASIHIPPALVALSKEPISVVIATNNVTNSRTFLSLQFTAEGPSSGQYFLLSFGGKNLTLTFRGNPNGSGTELPVPDPTSGVSKRYIAELAMAIVQNEIISEQFEIATDLPLLKIILRSKQDTPLSISYVIAASNLSATVVQSPGPYLKPNLMALLKVITRKGREVAKLTGNYQIERGILNDTEGHCSFDISSLLDVSPHLPDNRTLAPSEAFKNAIAFRAYAQYYLRYADKYGVPPVSEALYRTGPFWVINGGRSTTSTQAWTMDSNGIYQCMQETSTYTTIYQPNWYYFFTTKRLTIRGVVIFKTETATFEALIMPEHTIKANRMYYYRTGFEQLSLSEIARSLNISEEILEYEWRLVDTQTNIVLASAVYMLESCRYNSLYIAYDNGLGGINTVHAKGGYILRAEAERTVVRHTSSAMLYDTRFGALEQTEATVNHIYEVQIGLVKSEYASTLIQLLLGAVWLIDLPNKRFIRLITETKSIEVKTKIGGRVTISLQFKSAMIDNNAV